MLTFSHVKSPRLLEIISYKILTVQKEDLALENLVVGGTKTYRIEEIPADEVNMAIDEMLIPVAHFQKVIKDVLRISFNTLQISEHVLQMCPLFGNVREP